jgi:hypothetical protein
MVATGEDEFNHDALAVEHPLWESRTAAIQ